MPLTDEQRQVIAAFQALLPAHEASLTITHNDHKGVYETVEKFTEGPGAIEWASDEERKRAIETDEIWEVQWYPDTPVGFCIVQASSLEACFEHILSDD